MVVFALLENWAMAYLKSTAIYYALWDKKNTRLDIYVSYLDKVFL